MSASQRKIERVARAICSAARIDPSSKCPVCEQDKPALHKHDKNNCTMAPQFTREAIAAIDEIER